MSSRRCTKALVRRPCVALVLRAMGSVAATEGHGLFSDFLRRNSACFWNVCLMCNVPNLEYAGFLVPETLLVSGTDVALEAVRSAWARRVLRPPDGYAIHQLGDMEVVSFMPVLQTQFAPLSEALCKVVADMNGDQVPATSNSIRSRLEGNFPEMQVPGEDILHKALGGLIRERKLYHTGNGYFIASPDMWSVPPVYECPVLMANQEARLQSPPADRMDIAATSWTTKSTQVPSSADLQLLAQHHSVKEHLGGHVNSVDRGDSSTESRKRILSRYKEEMNDSHKNDKHSVFAKIFRRFLSTKQVVFSAQFPPLEWSKNVQRHSVATQTYTIAQKMNVKPPFMYPEFSERRIPWKDSPNYSMYKSPCINPCTKHKKLHNRSDESCPRINLSVSNRHPKYSPSHRYSHHGMKCPKPRQRYRKSSNENHKMNPATSKSNTNNSDDKTFKSSSSASPLTVPIKTKQTVFKPRLKGYESMSCHSKDDNVSGKETCSYSNSLDHELLKHLKNTSASRMKTAMTKKCIPLQSEIHNQNVSAKSNLANGKNSTTVVDQSPIGSFIYTEKTFPCSTFQSVQPKISIQSVDLKDVVNIPVQKPVNLNEIIVDNSVCVEVGPSIKSKDSNVSTTIVTEETTVSKTNGNSKVVTVTSITTSLSRSNVKDASTDSLHDIALSDAPSFKEQSSVNNLNLKTEKEAHVIDCSSSCNIVREVK